eukprot:TRINITY_DN83757_c0_g1_i1.p2 TRINITY_DN83757_c0_g1~~TRINITY_DN83757_c0_g1_i1.p2  ORF type:complete len:112 (+),score=17.52 TRINITY_DN83757_c0_g1_i1:53-388(+)
MIHGLWSSGPGSLEYCHSCCAPSEELPTPKTALASGPSESKARSSAPRWRPTSGLRSTRPSLAEASNFSEAKKSRSRPDMSVEPMPLLSGLRLRLDPCCDAASTCDDGAEL